MPPIIPPLRPADSKRATRFILALADGDDLAIRAVFAEASRDPIGVNGLVFALGHLARELADFVAPEGQAEDRLRDYLLQHARSDEDRKP